MAQGKNPWGRGTGGGGNGGGNHGGGFGGGRGPQRGDIDMDELLRKGHEKMRGAFGGDGNEGKIGVIAFLVLVLFWSLSGVYRVNPDELGVVLRFGEYERLADPGLNYHFPYPFETVLIPSVTTINKVEIGTRNQQENPAVRSARRAFNDRASNRMPDNFMLTGDRNIVDIDFEVQWKIDGSAPQDYLFNVRDPASGVRAVAESAMREVIGRNNLDEILTTAQSQIADETQAIMQEMFDNYKAGIEVIAVNLSRPDVPQPVIDEFQDVKRAEQDKETKETKAEGYRNDILPRAKGEAAQMLQKAEAYKSRVIAEATGDVSRFLAVYSEYKKSPTVTKERMYLETMEATLATMPKVIVDQDKSNFVPFMPLPGPSSSAAPQPIQPRTAN